MLNEMLFRSHTPSSPLSEFIEDFRLYENYAGEHGRERILPSGTFELVFNLREDELRIYLPTPHETIQRFSGAVVSGPYAGSFMTDSAEEAAILQVHFKPGGAVPFLGHAAAEFANAHVDLAAIWGPEAATLRDLLCMLDEPRQRFRLLERALLARLADRTIRHDATRTALDLFVRTHGQLRVRDVAEAVDLSQRRFIAVFAAEVGLTPKVFTRIQRFQHAIALSAGGASVDWAQIAIACGYFDQSHLIHEFVEFSGMSPWPLSQRQSQLQNAGVHVKRHHVPLAE